MREVFEWLLDGFIKKSTAYKEIEKEAENYNTECSRKQRRIEKLQHDLRFKEQEKQELVLSGQTVIEEKVETIKNLQAEVEKITQKNKTIENKRRKAVSSIGGLKKEINKLKEANDFLKKNRRSPSLEELKDYQYRRKNGKA